MVIACVAVLTAGQVLSHVRLAASLITTSLSSQFSQTKPSFTIHKYVTNLSSVSESPSTNIHSVMPASSASIARLQQQIWSGCLPLEIRLAASDCRTYDVSDPYLIQYPRLSYLAFLLPRLHAFFRSSLIDPDVEPHDAWLSFENVPLKWHFPLGLLSDLFSGTEPVNLDRREVGTSQSGLQASSASESLPRRLIVHYTEYPVDQLIQLDGDGRTMLDSYINSVKEADFIRNGTARTVMSLSKEDSDKLWQAVQTRVSGEHVWREKSALTSRADDLGLFNSINNKLLAPPGVTIKHVPLKVYLPNSASQTASQPIAEEAEGEGEPVAKAGHIRVVQSLVPLQTATRQPQTLGTALNGMLPTIFPSRRNPLLAQPVLHGAVAPMAANFEELGRAAAYCDGFLHVAVVMLG